MLKAVMPSLSRKVLLISGGGACLFYVCFASFVFLNGTSTLTKLESALPSETVAFASPDARRAAPEHGGFGHEGGEAHDEVVIVKDALLPAPYEGLSEETQQGFLPVIGETNNLTPFKAYKKPFVRGGEKPALALVVRNFNAPGVDFQNALKTLPNSISILLSPYDGNIDMHQKIARAMGHEVWLNIAFENQNFPLDDPGPRGILSHVGIRYNKDNLYWSLAQTNGYAGVAGFTDSAFDGAKPMLRGLMQDIFARGLGYFELNSDADGFSEDIALSSASPYIKNMLPEAAQGLGLEQALERLKLQAQVQNYAIAVLDLNPFLLGNISKLIAKAEEEGFELVPLGTLADNRL